MKKKKKKKLDTLAVIDNYNFCDKHTHRHGNSMTDPAQRAKSVKSDEGIILMTTLFLDLVLPWPDLYTVS